MQKCGADATPKNASAPRQKTPLRIEPGPMAEKARINGREPGPMAEKALVNGRESPDRQSAGEGPGSESRQVGQGPESRQAGRGPGS